MALAPRIDAPGALLLFGSQIVLLGSDLTQFFTLQNGSLSFIHDFNHGEGTLATGLVIPPAWTLEVEFAFYLVAPFIVRRSARAIAAVLFASLALRLILQFGFGLQDDPWSYRFFPSELAVFLVGALGYRVYRSSSNDARRRIFVLFAVACVCTAAALLINRGMAHRASRQSAFSYCWCWRSRSCFGAARPISSNARSANCPTRFTSAIIL